MFSLIAVLVIAMSVGASLRSVTVTVMFWQVADHPTRHGLAYWLLDCETWRLTFPSQVAEELNAKPYNYGRHYGPPRVAHMADSRVAHYRKLGFSMTTPDELPIMDRIYKAKELLPDVVMNEDDPDTFYGLSAFHAEFDELRGVFQQNPERDWCYEIALCACNFLNQYRHRAGWETRISISTDADYDG